MEMCGHYSGLVGVTSGIDSVSSIGYTGSAPQFWISVMVENYHPLQQVTLAPDLQLTCLGDVRGSKHIWKCHSSKKGMGKEKMEEASNSSEVMKISRMICHMRYLNRKTQGLDQLLTMQLNLLYILSISNIYSS
jgi:hypothetical protein